MVMTILNLNQLLHQSETRAAYLGKLSSDVFQDSITYDKTSFPLHSPSRHEFQIAASINTSFHYLSPYTRAYRLYFSSPPHQRLPFGCFVFQDFAIQQLERRIGRMQGERSNEEKVALEQRLVDLTNDLDEKNNTHNLLTLQLKRLQVRTIAGIGSTLALPRDFYCWF